MEQQVEAAQSEAARAQRVARHEARQEASGAEAKMREYIARFREQARGQGEGLLFWGGGRAQQPALICSA
jgi:hypothetical protein